MRGVVRGTDSAERRGLFKRIMQSLSDYLSDVHGRFVYETLVWCFKRLMPAE
jgi:hypothetical protein